MIFFLYISNIGTHLVFHFYGSDETGQAEDDSRSLQLLASNSVFVLALILFFVTLTFRKKKIKALWRCPSLWKEKRVFLPLCFSLGDNFNKIQNSEMLQMFSKKKKKGLWSLRVLSINQLPESVRLIYLTGTKEFVLNHYIFWNIGSQMKYQNREQRKKNFNLTSQSSVTIKTGKVMFSEVVNFDCNQQL